MFKRHAPVFIFLAAAQLFCAAQDGGLESKVTPAVGGLPAQEKKTETEAERPAPVLDDKILRPVSGRPVVPALTAPAAPEEQSTFSLIDMSSITVPLTTATSAVSTPAAQTSVPNESKKTETQKTAAAPANVPASAAAPKPVPAPAPKIKIIKKDYSKPGPSWVQAHTSNFNIFTDKKGFGMATPNIGMTFESAYASMRMNMPVPMPDKTNVYIYKTREDYLKGEFAPYQWSEALSFPTENTIVLYNTAGDRDGLKKDFMHEYTHMINGGYVSGLPLWLDEGMAVNMEDISLNAAGGEWAKDLLRKDLRAYKLIGKKNQKNTGGQILYFIRFNEFMNDKSLEAFSSAGKVQDWYLQAYAMVRFLWKPYNASTPENQIKFRQFMSLIKNGETVYDKNGEARHKKYTVEEALKKAYTFGGIDDFESKFWFWYAELRKSYDADLKDKTKR
ncbi:MAG: hypothetical protein LBI01_03430 [Elusimicrobium sp.]|jgi:hypothetical protein|nr:hypothetical protein [Elusimicrobium sp.]